jgi:hypothetical protein
MKRRLTGGITLLSDILCGECASREVVVWISCAGIDDIFWPETPKMVLSYSKSSLVLQCCST